MPTPDHALPGCFDGPAVAAAPERFIYALEPPVRAELERLLVALEANRELATIERAIQP